MRELVIAFVLLGCTSRAAVIGTTTPDSSGMCRLDEACFGGGSSSRMALNLAALGTFAGAIGIAMYRTLTE